MNNLELALDPNTPPDILDKLSTDSNFIIRYEVARNNNTSSYTLEKMYDNIHNISDYCDADITREIANNPNATPDVLDKLSTCFYPYIRQLVACNINSSYDTLNRLAEDKWLDVVESVARNPSTPLEILFKLSSSPSEKVIRGVLENDNASPELIKLILDTYLIIETHEL